MMPAAEKYFAELLPQATEISKSVSRRFFKRPASEIGMVSKADASPVTAADLEIESKLRDLIESKFPDHGIIGEEHGSKNTGAEFVWVLDPIDGTKSFITGVPLFTMLFSLMYQGEPVCGAIYQPILDELTWGNNRECFFNGRVTRMRETHDLAQATLLTTDVRHIAEHHPNARFAEIQARTKFWRTWGDGYGYTLLATGHADIMLDPIMNPWDIMAVVPVIRGAGGVISDLYGSNPVQGKSILAANAILHQEVLAGLGNA